MALWIPSGFRRRVAMLPPGKLTNRREFVEAFPYTHNKLKIDVTPESVITEEIYKKIQSIRDVLETTVDASRSVCANESYTRTFFHAIDVIRCPDIVYELSVSAKHVDVAFTGRKNIVELKGVNLTEQEIVGGLGRAIMYAVQLNAGPNLNRFGSFNGYVGIVYTGHRAYIELDTCVYGIRLARYDVVNIEDDIKISWEMEEKTSYLIVNSDGTVRKNAASERFLQHLLFIQSQPNETLHAADNEQQSERLQDKEEENRIRRRLIQEDPDKFLDELDD